MSRDRTWAMIHTPFCVSNSSTERCWQKTSKSIKNSYASEPALKKVKAPWSAWQVSQLKNKTGLKAACGLTPPPNKCDGTETKKKKYNPLILSVKPSSSLSSHINVSQQSKAASPHLMMAVL